MQKGAELVRGFPGGPLSCKPLAAVTSETVGKGGPRCSGGPTSFMARLEAGARLHSATESAAGCAGHKAGTGGDSRPRDAREHAEAKWPGAPGEATEHVSEQMSPAAPARGPQGRRTELARSRGGRAAAGRGTCPALGAWLASPDRTEDVSGAPRRLPAPTRG